MSVADLLYVSVVIFALTIVFGVVFSLQNELFPRLNSALNATGDIDPVTAGVIVDAQAVFPIFDQIALVGFVGAMVAILALAYLLPTNPLFAGINLIAMIVVFMITPALTNSYMEVADALPGVDVSVTYPYTYFLMQNYPLFIMVFGFALFVLLVARFRSGGQNDV